jgi:hypothetical protein
VHYREKKKISGEEMINMHDYFWDGVAEEEFEHLHQVLEFTFP